MPGFGHVQFSNARTPESLLSVECPRERSSGSVVAQTPRESGKEDACE